MPGTADASRAEHPHPSATPRTITATHDHARRTQYRRPGGAWDGPDLDTQLRAATPARIGAPHDALIDGDIRLTARDVDDLSAALAGGLQALGVRRRDAVVWQLANGYESVLLLRACWRLGAVAVPIEHHASAAEVDAVVAATEPAALVGARHLPLGRHADAVVVGGPSLPARRPGGPQAGGGPEGSTARSSRSGAPFAKLLAGEPVGATGAKPADVAVVLFAGGPRGARGGVIHTHRTLAAGARAAVAHEALGPADVGLVVPSLASATGLLHGVLVPTLAGMTTVLLPEWNPGIALDLIERERVSFLAGTPGAVRSLLREPSFSPRRVRRVRALALTDDRVTPAFVERAAARFGARAARVYGSAEAPFVATSLPTSHTTSHASSLPPSLPSAPPSSVATDHPTADEPDDGSPAADTEVRVVDVATGRDQPSGALGEVWLRGPGLFAGYLDAAQNPAAFARGGWFRTGDLGVLDDDGALTVVDPAAPQDGPTVAPDGTSSDPRTDTHTDADAGADPRAIVRAEDALQRHPAVDDAAVLIDATGTGAIAFVTRADGGASGAAADLTLADARAWLVEQQQQHEGDEEPAALVLTGLRVRASLPLHPTGQVDRGALRALVTGA